ncbi:Hypothetical protein HVR_LOCUS143 [uncultured virus]|nr:Hypothetical protein HVR_LOCUS143 [uncultured virus]
MQVFPRFAFPKLLLVRPTECQWVSNIIAATKTDPRAKQAVMGWKPGLYPDRCLQKHNNIMNDGHTGGTICWSVSLAQQILKNDSSMQEHEDGLQYALP